MIFNDLGGKMKKTGQAYIITSGVEKLLSKGEGGKKIIFFTKIYTPVK